MEYRINQLFKKGKKVDVDEKERQEMLSYFHRPDKEFEVKRTLFEDLSTETEFAPNAANLKNIFYKMWKIIEEGEQKQKNKSRLLSNALKIAAAVLIGLFIGIVTTDRFSSEEPIYYSSYSPKGSISEIQLPDSTIIFLNADSRIRYSMEGEGGAREVYISGEAWFDVKKDAEKPFIVHTPFYDVLVTGTQFNVKAFEDESEITTTLEEGQVIIKSGENSGIANELMLVPGEQIVLDKNTKKLFVKNVETKWYTSWKENKLIFVNMDLKELVTLLERRYGVEIVVRNTEILNLHFDGTIKNESIKQVLEILQSTLPIRYSIVDQKIEITSNK